MERRRCLSPDDPRLLTIDEALADHVVVLEEAGLDGSVHEFEYFCAVADARGAIMLVNVPPSDDHRGMVRVYRGLMPDLEH